MKSEVPLDIIGSKILFLRGRKVMLDSDLAKLYGLPTKMLVQAVKRNIKRFPADSIFHLKNQNAITLRPQVAASKNGRRQRRYHPYVFTEQGVAMLSSVLNSQRAIEVNILIVGAFVKLMEMIASHKDLARKFEELENKYDAPFRVAFDAIQRLMALPQEPHLPGTKRFT
ncbi:MAG: ORF6N domain-containing protein [bacterium]